MGSRLQGKLFMEQTTSVNPWEVPLIWTSLLQQVTEVTKAVRVVREQLVNLLQIAAYLLLGNLSHQVL